MWSAQCPPAKVHQRSGRNPQWWALVAPATTALDTLEKLRLDTMGAMASPNVQNRMNTLGVDLKGSGREELRAFMRTEAQRWQAVARTAGLQPQ